MGGEKSQSFDFKIDIIMIILPELFAMLSVAVRISYLDKN